MAHAVVVADDHLSGAFAEAAGTEWKALAPITGRPVLARVLEALRGSAAIEEIIVVGPDALDEAMRWPEGVERAPGGDCLPESLRAGLRRLGLSVPVVIAGAGLPFLTTEMVDALIAGLPDGRDVAVPAIRSSDFRDAYAGVPVREVRLREDRFVLPGILVAKPQAVLMNHDRLQKAYCRRHQALLAGWTALGFFGGLAYAAGLLSAEGVAARLTARLSAPVVAAHGLPPALAFTLRNVERYRAALALAGHGVTHPVDAGG